VARFIIQIFKQLSGSDREWSNRWLVEAGDLGAVEDVVPNFAAMEKQLHLDNVTLTRARVSDTTPGTDVFSIVPIGLIGTRATGADGDWLPIYNTVRVDISVAGGGRPSRKFYRGPILESDQQAGFLDSAIISLFDTQVNGLISFLSGSGVELVDPDGQPLTTAVTQARVQERQLHRKRKKKVTSP